MIHHYVTDGSYGFELSDLSSPVILRGDGVEGMHTLPVESFVRSSPLQDGQRFAGWRAPAREVFWPIAVIPHLESWRATSRLWWSMFGPGSEVRWDVTLDETRSLTVRLEKVTTPAYTTDPSRTGVEVFGLQLTADDPFWRGDIVERTFQTPVDAPASSFGAAGSGYAIFLLPGSTIGAATITNPGDIDEWPIVRIDGPVSSFSLSSSLGGPVSGAIEIPAGEYLEIDMHPWAQTATLNGWQDVTRQLDVAGFFRVPAGDEVELDVTLIGEGSATFRISPGYLRAF